MEFMEKVSRKVQNVKSANLLVEAKQKTLEWVAAQRAKRQAKDLLQDQEQLQLDDQDPPQTSPAQHPTSEDPAP